MNWVKINFSVFNIYNDLVKISNDQPEFECHSSNHELDTELTILCFVNKAGHDDQK